MWKMVRIELAQKIYKTLCKLTIAFMLGLWYSIIVQRTKTKIGGTKNETTSNRMGFYHCETR